MSIEFRLPELGENIAKGDLLKVLVSIGEQINVDQPVIELETDKATLEVPSSISGRVESVKVKPGEQVKVGQVILTVSDGDQAESKTPAAAKSNGAAVSVQEPAGERAEPQLTRDEASTKPSEADTGSIQAPHTAAATEFRLPELGENIEKGDLLKVLVSAGDVIQKDQPVIELETDKATLEVPSSVAGKIKEIHVKAGEQVKVGQLILTVEGGASVSGDKAAPKPANGTTTQQAQRAKAAEPAAAAAVSVPATGAEQAPRPSVAEPATRALVPAAPSVRRMARELGVDILQVTGTGPAGRISIEDVKAHVRKLNQARGARPLPGAVPLPDFTRWGAVEREAMRAVRRSTATHMAHAWATVPHVTQHDRADVTQLEQFRKQYSKKAEARGAKPTVTAFALKVVASALKLFPQFAASIDPAREEIVYKKYCHIGVAVDTDRGLLVPVIRDADRKNILELSIELAQAAEKARTRKLAPEDMEGGVFTITNLGGIGGTAFTPIVHWPEAAILGMSRSAIEPVYVEGQFQPRLMLPLSLSYDHRLIDGADAARFLRWVAEALEQLFLVPFEG